MTDAKSKQRLPIDWYLVALLATVGVAAIIPARGTGATAMGYVTYGAVALLFFLYGARLAPQAILAGIMHWRLQGLVFLSTFAVFPIVGFILVAIFRPWLMEGFEDLDYPEPIVDHDDAVAEFRARRAD